MVTYPVAYLIAFRGGRWRNLLLLGIVAPFFVTYLIRTLAWETILADHGLVVNTLRRSPPARHPRARTAGSCQTSIAVVAGITYNFLPFMTLPLYVSLEQIDPRLIEAAEDLYASKLHAFLQGDAPAVAARDRRRDAAHVHPRRRRLRQRRSCSARPRTR